MYYSSSAASSIYSQDGVIFPAPYDSDLQPLIERKDSSASVASKLSQASTLAPTVYTEEYIKTLGYRPFEYWKGPLPVAASVNGVHDGGRNKRLPVPPPPRALHRHSMAIRNSLRALAPGSLPQAKLRDSMHALADKATMLPPPPPPSSRRPRPPPSPRVKDRYKHRYKLPRKEGEWPGWEPDEAVVAYFARRFAAEQEKERLKEKEKELGVKKTKSWKKTTKKTTTTTTPPLSEKKKQKKGYKGRGFWFLSSSSSHGAHNKKVSYPPRRKVHKSYKDIDSDSGSIRLWGESERLLKPQTWTRRSWGIVTLLLMLLLGVILILVSTLSRGGDSAVPTTTQPQAQVAGAADEGIASVRRAIHGGSVFRFGAIRHTP